MPRELRPKPPPHVMEERSSPAPTASSAAAKPTHNKNLGGWTPSTNAGLGQEVASAALKSSQKAAKEHTLPDTILDGHALSRSAIKKRRRSDLLTSPEVIDFTGEPVEAANNKGICLEDHAPSEAPIQLYKPQQVI